MELTLNRKLKLENKTIGELLVNGKKFCDTLEDKVRLTWSLLPFRTLLGVKIWGKTAIPSGRYEVVITYSNRFKRRLPLLIKVPQFEGIRMHSGIDENSSSGCLICGKLVTKTNTLYGGKSLGIVDNLVKKIDEGSKLGKVYITIND